MLALEEWTRKKNWLEWNGVQIFSAINSRNANSEGIYPAMHTWWCPIKDEMGKTKFKTRTLLESMNLNSSAEQPPTDHSKIKEKKQVPLLSGRISSLQQNWPGRRWTTGAYIFHLDCIYERQAPPYVNTTIDDSTLSWISIFIFGRKDFFTVVFMWTNMYLYAWAKLKTYCSEWSRRLADWNCIKCALVDWRWFSIFFCWKKRGQRRVLTTNGLMKIVHFTWMYSVSRSMTVGGLRNRMLFHENSLLHFSKQMKY